MKLELTKNIPSCMEAPITTQPTPAQVAKKLRKPWHLINVQEPKNLRELRRHDQIPPPKRNTFRNFKPHQPRAFTNMTRIRYQACTRSSVRYNS